MDAPSTTATAGPPAPPAGVPGQATPGQGANPGQGTWGTAALATIARTELVVNAPIPFYKMPSDAWTAPLEALADYRTRGGGVKGVAPQLPNAGKPTL